MNRYPHVMSPIRIRGQFIKNRVISAPTTLHTASNGELWPTEEAMKYFEARAKAGCGIVTVTGVTCGPASDNGYTTSWDLYQKNHTHRLAQLAKRIQSYGAKASMELMGIFPDGYTVCDGCSIMGGPGGREIPPAAMEDFKKSCADAAVILKKLGYDGLLFHFGHAVPVAQFLSPLTNKRADKYGGSTENRCRYPIEILDAVRQAVGGDMFFEVRISGNEFIEGGIDLEEGIRIGQLLQEHCDILQCSAGMHNAEGMTTTHPCGFLPPMPNVHIAEALRKSGKIHVPLTAIGAIPDLDAAEEIVALGKADFVTMARTLIADIEMLDKCKAGHSRDVRPCVKCMLCHDSSGDGYHFRCTVNPEVGLQHIIKDMDEKPLVKKRVAIVGGGPAGMQAALTASGRGHDVTLFEKNSELGGKISYAKYVSFKYPLDNYLKWLLRQVEQSNIEVRLDTEATPETVRGYDAVIATVGSEPFIPPIPGVELAVPALEVFGNEDMLSDNVTVLGGGQVGCEMALHLARHGRNVTVLEMRDSIAPDAMPSPRDELALEISKAKDKIKVITGARCSSVTNLHVEYEKDGERRVAESGSVVLCLGMRAKWELADSFMALTADYAEAGDCVKARNVADAVQEGYFAALRL